MAREIAVAESAVAEAGFELATARRAAADTLRRDVTAALSSLAMEGGRFDVSLVWEEVRPPLSAADAADAAAAGGPPSSHTIPCVCVAAAAEVGEREGAAFRVREGGFDRVTFLLAAGPNEPLRSMGAIASGGEKARLMLALKLAPAMRAEAAAVAAGSECDDETGSTSRHVTGSVLDAAVVSHSGNVSVFDELDSGVGARIGARIGAALQRLSSKGGQQVLCVTHLPQVAAHGDLHLRISKGVSRDPSGEQHVDTHAASEALGARPSLRTTITIDVLGDEEARIDEISAMLGLGDSEGRVSAARLLSISRVNPASVSAAQTNA